MIVIAFIIYRTIKKRGIERQHKIITKLYCKQNAFHLSKAERQRRFLLGNEWIYGEIGLQAMLGALSIAKPQANESFIDLGSGSGIAVLITAIFAPMKQYCGIEFLEDLIHYSQSQVTALLKDDYCPKRLEASQFQFIHGDYWDHDFEKFDIIYLNATALTEIRYQEFCNRVSRLKSGARIIITSKTLPLQSFHLIDARTVMMSWGYNQLRIYQKK